MFCVERRQDGILVSYRHTFIGNYTTARQSETLYITSYYLSSVQYDSFFRNSSINVHV